MSYLAKSLAAQIIRSAVDDIDYISVGEAMLDDYEELSEDDYTEVQNIIYRLIRDAELTIEFEDGTLY